MISKTTVDHIQQAADIVEVISDFVPLKKKGQNLMACCPFHNEKSPSFSVSPTKGIYKCFGCGKAGDSIRFIMDIESITYVEALRYLAKKYNIPVEEDTRPTDQQQLEQNERESILIALNFAKNYYQHLLLEDEEGRYIGLSYFKERGFNEKTVKAFDLGYSFNAWTGLTDAAVKAGFSKDILVKAGLTIVKEDKIFDRFRGRVIFPIHNISGKTIAFGARILKADKDQPKYLNSPETEVYHKSRVLYGLFQAKQAIRNEDNCYLVEGYTDVISLHQAGIENVVASSGTSLTEEQIKLVGRFTQNITVLFDGDLAGVKASVRGIDMILESGLNVRVVTFPNNDDPDSYLRKVGAQAFKEHLKEQNTDFISFKISLFIEEAAKDPIKKAALIRDIVESISKIPDSIKRSVLFKQCAKLLDVDETVLIAESNKILINQRRQQKPAKQNEEIFPGVLPPDNLFEPEGLVGEEEKAAQPDAASSYEKEIIRMLISYAGMEIESDYFVCDYLLDQIKDVSFYTPAYARVLELFRQELGKGYIPHTDFFIKHPDWEVQSVSIDLIADKYELSEQWENVFKIHVPKETDNLPDATFKAVLRLKQEQVKRLIHQNMQQLMQAGKEGNLDEELRCMQVHAALKQTEAQIASHLGNVIA
jgi:DNA primase